jgi:signal transduction histidine kinase
MFCVLWMGVTVLLVHSILFASKGTQPFFWDKAKPLFTTIMWWCLYGYSCFQYRRLVIAEKKLLLAAGIQPGPKKPTFLWQGLLILLPVVFLTVVGLLSLHQDRLQAEQDAREQGASLARQLAKKISDEAVSQLRDYNIANFDLNANRTDALQLSGGWAGGAHDESNALVSIRTWQQANPAIDLSAMPAASGELNLRGEFCSPKIYPLSPQPPDWLGKLTPDQHQLWQEAEQAELMPGDANMAGAAFTNFLATKPPTDAWANAEYHLFLLKTRRPMPAESLTKLVQSYWGHYNTLTEAGLPLGQLVCYRALRLLPDKAGVPYQLFNCIAWAINYSPSILAPHLIAEAERVAAPGPTNSADSVATLKSWWYAEDRARQILRTFQEDHPIDTWTNMQFWITASGNHYLLTMLDNDGQTLNPVTVSGLPREAYSKSYRYALFPEAVVDQALSEAVANADISLPSYAELGLAIGGKELVWRQNHLILTTNPPTRSVLGEAPGLFRDLTFTTNSDSTRVQILLNDSDALYARQHQHALWFSSLILASMLAALVGFIAALRAFRRQQQLNESKSNFVSSVSHELRAPIASVRLMAENLAGGKISEPVRQQEYYQFIVQECHRLSSLIENVLDFSRIEQGRKQYEFEPTDLLKLTRSTVTLMEPYALEKGVTLRLEAGPAYRPPIELNIDGRAIQQALVNLLDNAIKHSARGQTVTVGLEPQVASAGPVLHLWVADQGPGIPAAEQERIFERFYRLGSELRRETQGIGIGLSIVKHIMTAHGGRGLVASEPGRGSRFTLELPVKKTNE